MSDPQRLRDGGDDLGRALLRSAGGDGPDPARRAQVAAALGLGVGLGAAQVASAASAGASGAGASGVFGFKLLLAAGALAGVALGTHALVRREPVLEAPGVARAAALRVAEGVPVPVAVSVPVAAAVPVPVAAPDPAPVPIPAPAAVVRPIVVPPAVARPALRSPETLAAEVAALDQVRAALAHHDARLGHEALELYAIDFPAGALAPEALALEVEVDLQAGDRAAADAAFARLAHDHGGSPVVARVKKLLAR